LAIQENAKAIRYVYEADAELQLLAVKKNRYAYFDIVNPTPEAREYVDDNSYFIERLLGWF
jgi:hypothetical protein